MCSSKLKAQPGGGRQTLPQADQVKGLQHHWMDDETFLVLLFGQALLSVHQLLNYNHSGTHTRSILFARHFSTNY
jgi:hypothetical protein